MLVARTVMTNRPPSVILAGGLARRMGGGHKSMLKIDGVPMLDLSLIHI